MAAVTLQDSPATFTLACTALGSSEITSSEGSMCLFSLQSLSTARHLCVLLFHLLPASYPQADFASLILLDWAQIKVYFLFHI